MIRRGKQGAPTVLVLDDEAEMVEALAETLYRDYRVAGTTSTDEALRLLAEEDFDCIIADQRMPAMQGAEVLARGAKISPTTVRLLITGYTDIDALVRAINEASIFHYLTKPWDNAYLIALVGEVVEQRRIKLENRRLLDRLGQVSHEIATERDWRAKIEAEHKDLARESYDLRSTLEQLNSSYWHLKRIQELLPICCQCGKVRNEDGNWEELPAYLGQRADFLTHGYCPSCLVNLEQEIDAQS